MEEQKSKLRLLTDVAKSLNNEMHKALAEFIGEHGGLIRTDKREDKDTMYACVINIDTAYDTKECAILAVRLTDDGQVAILPDYTYDAVNLDGLSDEEILASEDWVLLMGGDCIINATAYQLCECLEEYVEQ